MKAGRKANASSGWTVRLAVLWAALPFILGVTLGVLVRRTGAVVTTEAVGSVTNRPQGAAAAGPPNQAGRFRPIADLKAELLLAKLESSPDDPELLAEVGNIYYVTQNFREACNYFKRSVDIRDDATVRINLGRAYFYAGNSDDALAEFEQVLRSDPNNADAMFNVGMVKWQSKLDVDGALTAWQQIIEKHPNHSRRAEVETLIRRAKQHRDVK